MITSEQRLQRTTNRGTVYGITNTLTGQMYIGSSVQPVARWKEHQGLLRSGKHPNKPLQADFNRFGADVFIFEVMEVLPEPLIHHLLLRRENEYIRACLYPYNSIGREWTTTCLREWVRMLTHLAASF